MLVNKFKILFFYSLITLLLTFLVIFIFNPDQVNILSYNSNRFFRPNIFHLNKIDKARLKGILKSAEKSQYRGGTARQGYFKINFNPLNLKLSSLGGSDINYSGHGASKSTPIHLAPYSMVAGDQGILKVYRNKKLYWTLNLLNKGFGFHSTPIIVSDIAFVGDYSGRFYFLDLKKKKLYGWRNSEILLGPLHYWIVITCI